MVRLLRPFGARNDTFAGFTLVEMLVALTVFSIIALSISGVFRSGIRTWRAGNEWSEENQIARAFFRQISKELTNNVNNEPDILFEGDGKEVSFMALLDVRHPKEGMIRELARVVYRYEDRALKRWTAGKEEGFDVKYAKEELIASDVEEIRFDYAYKPVYEDEDTRWKKEWKDSKEIPRGVRIRMGDFHTIVFVPTGVLGDESALHF